MDTLLFDYQSLSKTLNVQPEIVQEIEKQVRTEFPDDEMLMELHVLRTIKSYVSGHERRGAE
jgi:hypothetical protein